jgi:hypothetical protein
MAYGGDVNSLFGVQQNVVDGVDEFVTNLGPARNVEPVPPAAAAIAPVALTSWSGTIIRCDVSGGAFVQLLPALPQLNGSKGTGRLFVVYEESDTVGLDVKADGVNTINGSVAAVSVPKGGAILLVNDGLSNWTVLSKFPGAGGGGGAMVFGANALSAGRYYVANGTADSVQIIGAGIQARCPVVADGNITRLVWMSDNASATTKLKLYVNAVLKLTQLLTGTEGVITGLAVPVLAADAITIEYDTGLQPKESLVLPYVEYT